MSAARLGSWVWALVLVSALVLRARPARADPVLAFVIQSSRGTGTGFLVRDPGGQQGVYLVTALHVVAGVSCALATPFPACPEDPQAMSPMGPAIHQFTSCDAAANGPLKLSKQPALIWVGHDLVAIKVDEPSLPPTFVAGHIGARGDLPQTAWELFLQGAGANDACPNGGGRLRYYVQAGRFAQWAEMRSKGKYKGRDFIGTVTQGQQLLVMSSTGSPGASGGPVTREFGGTEVFAMYQGGDGRGQSTWAVVLTEESLRAEAPLARSFGDWRGVVAGNPALAQVDSDLTDLQHEFAGSASRLSPPFSLDIPELVFEANPSSSNPVYEVGAQFGGGAHLVLISPVQLELHGALHYARRWNRVRFEGPSGASQSQPLEERGGQGGSLGLEGGIRVRLSRQRRFPSLGGDVLVRGRIIDESRARDESWSGAWGPVVRVRACGAFSWSWGFCVGAGVVYEYYRPARYVYDGFGDSKPAEWRWSWRGQIVAGIEYAP